MQRCSNDNCGAMEKIDAKSLAKFLQTLKLNLFRLLYMLTKELSKCYQLILAKFLKIISTVEMEKESVS